MSDDLYQERLLALARSLENDADVIGAHGIAVRDNPLCGDRATVGVWIADGRLQKVAQQIRGCLLCRAAAAALARTQKLSVDDARETAAAMSRFLREGAAPPEIPPDSAAFLPVRRFPSRHQCVLLPFEGLLAALDEAESKKRK